MYILPTFPFPWPAFTNHFLLTQFIRLVWHSHSEVFQPLFSLFILLLEQFAYPVCSRRVSWKARRLLYEPSSVPGGHSGVGTAETPLHPLLFESK